MSPCDEDHVCHGTGAGTGAQVNQLANSQIFKKINIFKWSETISEIKYHSSRRKFARVVIFVFSFPNFIASSILLKWFV